MANALHTLASAWTVVSAHCFFFAKETTD